MALKAAACIGILASVAWAPAQVAAPSMEFAPSAALDKAINAAIAEKRMPGAVLLVGRKDGVLYGKAYGNRALQPAVEPMTLNTIFDCASLTKVVATTSAVMKLFEEGKLRLNDRVTEYLPEFQGGKSDITIRNLLTHFSGLRPDVDLRPVWSGYDTGIKKALVDRPVADPGARFIYSDINFLLLGEIVHRLSGLPLDEYVKATVFDPLGMKDSAFRPSPSLVPRIAPTERLPNQARPLRGTVHDETTRYMGGVAGHAGVFSTAGDLARFAEMMLGHGTRQGVQVFSPLTVEKFTTPQSPPDQPILRGLGWDIDSSFSSNRGELFPIGSYGHTGFTGTSLWIDPVSASYVVLLTNSVHPVRKPAISSLRSRVATIVAAHLGRETAGRAAITGYNETLTGAGVRREVARTAEVLTGLDVMAAGGFASLQGKRVGLITNHTGLDRNGRRNVDLMLAAGVQVAALFSPEHGIAGAEDHENVGHAQDKATGIKVWSLYEGKNRRPSPEVLRGLDALVFDIQDIGVRFYTYISTMGYAMEAAAKARLPFIVLDRPNPITGVRVEGPLLEAAERSFIGYFPMPVRHGMTIGEMARMFNEENKIGADLTVIAMQNWQRGDWFDATGLTWVDPSPNMRNLTAAVLYPGVALLEASTNYSVGRGTDAPFEVIGADFIQGQELAAYLNRRVIPGVRTYPVRFRPSSSNFKAKTIDGVRLVVTNREVLDSTKLGLEIAAALWKLYPGKLALAANHHLIGNPGVIASLERGDDPRLIHLRQEEALATFLPTREKYLLYR